MLLVAAQCWLSKALSPQVKIEAAFGTLRKQAVSDELDIKQLVFKRQLGKGAHSPLKAEQAKKGETCHPP